MKRCVITTILLMLSLEALVVAGRLSAAVADDVGIIRLPSVGKGLADQVTAAMKKGDEERPWKCCDLAICTMSFPPTCRCLDMVEQCASACKLCEAVESDPSRYTCQDWHHGDPGPRCTEEGNEDVVVVRGAAGGAAGEVRNNGGGDKGKRSRRGEAVEMLRPGLMHQVAPADLPMHGHR